MSVESDAVSIGEEMTAALIVVDVQRDFTPGGALGVAGGDRIIDRINELIRSDRFDLVVATRDWHPPDHQSFESEGGRWPRHCVAGSEGAALDPRLDSAAIDVVIDKGRARDAEGYSGFEETELESLLRERSVEEVTIVGLTTDYCVEETALDAVRDGFAVTVDASATAAVEASPGDAERAVEEMRAAGATVTGEPVR